MKAFSLKILAKAMQADLRGAADGEVTGGVCTDTRTMARGSLFFALRGENFDGHNFLEAAAAGGAAALVVEREEAGNFPTGVALLKVDDVLLALQRLAAWYRRELGIPVVAITGSNGKTSTKDLTRAVLARRFKVNATRGNLNNHIGLPLTLLATEGDDELCILEMGMNHAGELAPLCEIARPDIGIITNVGTAHIENLGSREAIAEEKGTLAEALTEKGTLLMPADCPFLKQFKKRTRGTCLTVGGDGAAVRAEKLVFNEDGCTFDLLIEGLGTAEVSLAVTGRHMVGNALLAAGAGSVLGMGIADIAAGLGALELTGGRMRRFSSHGVTVLDDTYNANPDSVLAAIGAVAEMEVEPEAKKYVVLGLMAELGEHAEMAHVQIGTRAAEDGLQVVAVGNAARGIATGADGDGVFFAEKEEAAEWLDDVVQAGDVVLFKGSRMAAMEELMARIFPED